MLIVPGADDAGTASSFSGAPLIVAFDVRSDNITIENLTIDGSLSAFPGASNFRNGIIDMSLASGQDGLRVRNITMRHIQRYGAFAGTGASSTGHVIENSLFEDIGLRAIAVYEGAATIQNNAIYASAESMWVYNYSSSRVISITGNAVGGASAISYYGVNVVGAGAGTSISNNTIDISGSGQQVGMILWYPRGSHLVQGNSIQGSDDDTGLVIYNANAAEVFTVNNNTLTATSSTSSAPGYSTGILVTDYGAGALAGIIGDTDGGNAHILNATGNTIQGWHRGIDLYGHGTPVRTITATLTSNIIRNNTIGVRLYEADGATGGYVVTASITNHNNPVGGDWTPAIYSNGTGVQLEGGQLTAFTNNVLAQHVTAGANFVSGNAPNSYPNNCIIDNAVGVQNSLAGSANFSANWWGDPTGAVDGVSPRNADAVNGTVDTSLPVAAAITNCSPTPYLPPSIAQTFSPASIAPGATALMQLTISNPNLNPLSGVSVSDILPLGLTVTHSPAAPVNTCGGALNAVDGNSQLQLTGGALPPGTSCTVDVYVTGNTPGVYTNSTTAVVSAEGGAGNTAAATLTIATAPPVVVATAAPSSGQSAPSCPPLALLQSASGSTAAGSQATFTFTIRNNSDVTSCEQEFRAQIPGSLDISQVSTTQGTVLSQLAPTVVVKLGALGPGTSAVVTITGRIVSPAAALSAGAAAQVEGEPQICVTGQLPDNQATACITLLPELLPSTGGRPVQPVKAGALGLAAMAAVISLVAWRVSKRLAR